jgi:PTH1 family peptidyl-tRNA hydrolase
MLDKLILVGLGNPGVRYESTRHNMGFLVVDAIAAKRGFEWKRGAANYHRCEFESASLRVILVKPQTYMNLSGGALLELRESRPFEPKDLLVVVDDIALPLGALRLRKQGSDGGHNGLGSIIEELGTTRFPRLRLGVGPVPPDTDPADFVLAPIPSDETEVVQRVVRVAVRCVQTVLTDGFGRAMGRFNTVLRDPESG